MIWVEPDYFDCDETEFLFDLDNDYDAYSLTINPRDKYLTAAAV